MNETIFITGLSGSGKTTKSNKFIDKGYEVLHLDEIEKYYTKGRVIQNKIIYNYINHIYGERIDKKPIYNQDKWLIIDLFIKYITTLPGKYVVEGVQIYLDADLSYLKDYKIYICDTSFFICLIRRFKRGIHKDVPLNIKICNIFKYDLALSHIIDYYKYKKFKIYFQERNKELEVL